MTDGILLRGPLSGWRLFTLDGDRLLAPFQAWYWPDTGDSAWRKGPNVARCLGEPHKAPAAACSCGIYGVRVLTELVETAGALSLDGSPNTLLQDAPVLARIRHHGLIYADQDRPPDPPSTIRSSTGSLLELFVPPDLHDAAAGLRARYGVPVTVLRDWPAAADPDVYVWELLPPHLGVLVVRARANRGAVENLIRLTADAIRGAVTRSDAASVLCHSNAKAGWAEAMRFVDAVVRAYVPELAADPDGLLFGEQVYESPFRRVADQIRESFSGVG